MTQETLNIIKVGGNIIDDDERLTIFLSQLAALNNNSISKTILVHGGGKLATRLASKLGIEQQLIEGRRITDEETLKVVTMVYAGYINKNIVATLQANNCNAIGISGADGNAIKAHKRVHPTINYGFVGDIDEINVPFLTSLLNNKMVVVVAPITHNGEGQLLNTNADTIAQELAKQLSSIFQVNLIYSFEKSGVLMDAGDNSSVINQITETSYKDLKERKIIYEGMIPKLDNAFRALNSGVNKVVIGDAMDLPGLLAGRSGTTISIDK